MKIVVAASGSATPDQFFDAMVAELGKIRGASDRRINEKVFCSTTSCGIFGEKIQELCSERGRKVSQSFSASASAPESDDSGASVAK